MPPLPSLRKEIHCHKNVRQDSPMAIRQINTLVLPQNAVEMPPTQFDGVQTGLDANFIGVAVGIDNSSLGARRALGGVVDQ